MPSESHVFLVIRPHALVRTDSRWARNVTAALVREAYFRQTDEWCTLEQAAAAAMTVPDGAPVEMAAVNVV